MGQGLLILCQPILTRLYAPAEFGLLTIYTTLVGFLAANASLRYELAIPLPPEDEVSINLIALCTGLVIATSIAGGAALSILGDPITSWTNSRDILPHLWMISLGVLGGGLYEVVNYWGIRKKAFGPIARAKVGQSVTQPLTQVGMGIFAIGPVGLLAGDVAGKMAGSLVMIALMWRQHRGVLHHVSIAGVRQAAARYRRFPIFLTASTVLNRAGLLLPPLLISGLYGPQTLGWFTLSQRVMLVPTTLVGQAVAQVYLNDASRLAHHDPAGLRQLFLKTSRRLFIIGIVPVAVACLGGPWLFGVAFGATWREAGLYAQLLSPMALAGFAALPLSMTLNILEKQDWQMAWDVIYFVVLVGGVALAAILKAPPTIAVATYSIGTTVAYIASFLMIYAAIARRTANTPIHPTEER